LRREFHPTFYNSIGIVRKLFILEWGERENWRKKGQNNLEKKRNTAWAEKYWPVPRKSEEIQRKNWRKFLINQSENKIRNWSKWRSNY
jgi:hypothetical protein